MLYGLRQSKIFPVKECDKSLKRLKRFNTHNTRLSSRDCQTDYKISKDATRSVVMTDYQKIIIEAGGNPARHCCQAHPPPTVLSPPHVIKSDFSLPDKM